MTPHTPVADLDHVLAHTRWSGLRGMRLFVTGGTGFLGRWLLDSLTRANDRADLGATAVALTRDPARFLRIAPHLAGRSDLRFHPGDVRDFDFPAGRFTHVLHAATDAGSGPTAGHGLADFDAALAGTRRVLEFAAASGAGRFLFASSGAVYGRQPPDRSHLPETYPGGPDPTDPRSTYAEGKRAAELMTVLAAREHGFVATLARCFAFVGPHLPLDAHYAAGNFLRDAVAGGPVRVGGDGTPVRSYLYAADLAVWLWTLLADGPAGAVNVGSGEPVSVGELAAAVAELAGVDVTVARQPTPGAPAERYVPDVSRAAGLGLRVRVPLAAALGRSLAWARAARPAAAPTLVSA